MSRNDHIYLPRKVFLLFVKHKILGKKDPLLPFSLIEINTSLVLGLDSWDTPMSILDGHWRSVFLRFSLFFGPWSSVFRSLNTLKLASPVSKNSSKKKKGRAWNMQSYYIHSYSNMLVLKMYLLIGKFLLDFSMTVINSCKFICFIFWAGNLLCKRPPRFATEHSYLWSRLELRHL